MPSLLRHLRHRWLHLWADDAGAEIAEWVVIVAFILVTAIAIYQGILASQLNNTVNSIGTKIASIASTNPT